MMYTDSKRMKSETNLRSKIMELQTRLRYKDKLIKELMIKNESMTHHKKLNITHPEVHDEDAIIITAKSIKSLLHKQKERKCCKFCQQDTTSIRIEKRTGRFIIHYMCDTCNRVVCSWESDVNWNEGNGGVTRKFAQGITASGINYWQYKRACQFTCLYYLRPNEWNVSNDALYPIVKDLCEEFMKICQHIAARLSPQGCKGAFDTTWSHKLKAAYASGCVVDTLTRAILWRYTCCAKRNSADPTAPVYTDTSASMESYCAKKCFENLVRARVKLELMAFDGDASTPQHYYSHYPDGTATRDPNHIGKNVYIQLLAIYDQLKYTCNCAHIMNKNGTKSRKRKHNAVTKVKAKAGQVWVGKILRETKSVDVADKLIRNYLDHLEGVCKPGGGCKHNFPYNHKSPVNCPAMMKRIRSYFEANILAILDKIIVDGVGAVDTNTNESVNMLIRSMRDKVRVLGAALNCVRTDIAYLMQNQKCITRRQPASRRHYLAELLQRCGHVVTQDQLQEWISEAEQNNIKDDNMRTPEQKKRRMERKFGTDKSKSTNNHTGKDCDDYYHSGGKGTAEQPIDLLQDDPQDDQQDDGEDRHSISSDRTTLNQFSISGLKRIATDLIQKVGGDVSARTQDIPTTGRGQKKAWLDMCMDLIGEQQLMKLQVPVSVCRVQHRIVKDVDAHGPAVLALHPVVWDVRITFEDKWSMIVFFDLETTGLGVYQAQIIQFGAVCALSKPGEPLQLLGTYNDYVLCKMRFPRDVTTLTGIKHWYHEDSQLRGAPTLREVNDNIKKKIVEWRQSIQSTHKRKIYVQLVGWNSDNYDIPLWQLQTDEHEGEGAWQNRFLGEDTGLVSHTDLYRVTPHADLFGPKSVDDIEVYMTKESQRGKQKKKRKFESEPEKIQYDSPQSAMFAYLKVQFPDALELTSVMVNQHLLKHNSKVGPALEELIETIKKNMIQHKHQNRKKSTTKKRKATKWAPPTNLGKFHIWFLGREIHGYHGALQDAQALYDIYVGKVREASEKYLSPTKKQKNKYVAKSLAMKYKAVQLRARTKAKTKGQHGISRKPYGRNPGRCIGHQYPCSLAVEKRKGSCYYGQTYECCNWAFKSHLRKNDNRRCGHKVVLKNSVQL